MEEGEVDLGREVESWRGGGEELTRVVERGFVEG